MDPPPLSLSLSLSLVVLLSLSSALPVPGASRAPGDALLEVALDMSPLAFDDRYAGCASAMAAALPALNRSEFGLGGSYAEGWALAAAEWHVRGPPKPPLPALPPAQAMALLAYTAPVPLHRDFNAATRVAGRSPRAYRDEFPFKALHFLLSQALLALRGAQRGAPRCQWVYRGVSGVRFVAQPGRTVRFGHFASASRRNESAWAFGGASTFHVHTCHGATISAFSFFPGEDEVLIPPFETFQVTEVTNGTDGTGVRIGLRSTGTLSNYNCEWVRGQNCGDRPCVFNTGRSTPGDPPHLMGLLLVTAALAVATGTP